MSYPIPASAIYDTFAVLVRDSTRADLRCRLQTCGKLLSANIGDDSGVSQLLLLDDRGVRDLIYALQQWLALKEGMG